MRVEHREIRWYLIGELKEHDERAYESALEKLDIMLWQNEHHHEDIADTIVMGFARVIGEPAAEQYGEADYPGVPGVELKGWAVADRSEHVEFAGTLNRENAPSLPWHEWIDDVVLTSSRYGTSLEIRESDEAPYVGFGNTDPALKVVLDEMMNAVGDALSEALTAGNKQAEYVSSEEYLVEMCEDNTWEFTANGDMS